MSDSVSSSQPSPSGFAELPWSVESLASRPARLSVLLVGELAGRIISGRYAAGSLLPPEPALCRSFDVSRSVVREAIKSLEDKGLVRARQGQGTTVTAQDEWNLLDPIVLDAAIRHDDSLQILDDLVAVRVALESQMVRAAADRITESDLAELGRLLRQLESELDDPPRYLETDTQFHDFILRCSGNRLGRSIIRSIHPYARASSRYSPPAGTDDIRQSHRGHVAIFECLSARDAGGAAAAMTDHITGTWTARKQKRPSDDSAEDSDLRR